MNCAAQDFIGFLSALLLH